jgi:hypothetical protein
VEKCTKTNLPSQGKHFSFVWEMCKTQREMSKTEWEMSKTQWEMRKAGWEMQSITP